MRLNSLRAFRYVFEFGSISAAAAQQNLSQPAVSRLLSSLEKRLDMPLFFRRGRYLVPTPEGEQFYAQTHRLLATIDDLPRMAKEIREGGSLRIRLLAMPRVAAQVAVPVVAEMRERLPNVAFQLDIMPRREMEGELNRLNYDFAIAALPINGTVATIEPTNVQRLFVVAPRDHALAGAAELGLSDLAGADMIGLPPHARHRQEMEDMFRSFSIAPRIVVTVSAIEAAIDLAGRGVGLTLADGMMREIAHAKGCVMIPLSPARSVTYAIIRPPISAPHNGSELVEDALRRRFAALPEQ